MRILESSQADQPGLQSCKHQETLPWPGMMALAFNPSTLETEHSGSLHSPAHSGLSQKDRDKWMDGQIDGPDSTSTKVGCKD